MGTVKPSTLIPRFRRQAIALKLAYSHAIMHANRPFLLGQRMSPSPGSLPDDEEGNDASAIRDSVAECIAAARVALETINGMASDGTLFNAFWWTSYVTFCALAVVYVCEIQRGGGTGPWGGDTSSGTQFPRSGELVGLDELAERCRARLDRGTSVDSPNRRYIIVLEELRLEARRQSSAAATRSDESNKHGGAGNRADIDARGLTNDQTAGNAGDAPPPPPPLPLPQQQQQQDPSDGTVGDSALDQYTVQNMLDGWQTTDWLDLDSSVCFPIRLCNVSD